MTPTKPPVAVLLPVRDGARTLGAALESLRAQTSTDFRLFVIDDGSRDETPELLRREQGRWGACPGLTIIRLEEPAGIAAALAVGAAAARDHPFLARQDADDRSLPPRLERQRAFLESHPEVALVATDVRLESAAPITDGWRRYERWLRACGTPEEIARNLWIESPLPHPTVMLRREAYDRAGGYREGPWPEDYDLWLRMHRAGAQMAKLSEELYVWTDHPMRASRTQPQYRPEQFLACKAHHLAAFLGGRSVIVWGAGRDGRRTARALLREGARITAFLDIDPRKTGRKAYGLPIREAGSWLAEPVRSDAQPGENRPIVLVAVGLEGAREVIRPRLLGAGLVEGDDFLCVA